MIRERTRLFKLSRETWKRADEIKASVLAGLPDDIRDGKIRISLIGDVAEDFSSVNDVKAYFAFWRAGAIIRPIKQRYKVAPSDDAAADRELDYESDRSPGSSSKYDKGLGPRPAHGRLGEN